MKSSIVVALMALVLGCGPAVRAQATESQQAEDKPMTQKALMQKLQGKWSGSARTWFEPDKLADESAVSGEISAVLEGRFLRHVYTGQMQGKPRHGEEMIAFDHVHKRWQVAWVDDFHSSYAILFSEGPDIAKGFAVRGSYDIGDGSPAWGWRTDYELLDDDTLRITAWNIMPDGVEGKAVETIYRRQ